MPAIIDVTPAARTETQANKSIDLDKELFKATKTAWNAKSQSSVHAMLERFDILKDAFIKRERKCDDAWKNFVSNELGIKYTTASKLIAIAEYSPFRNKKYQSMLPLSWTVLYPLTMLREEADKITYESFSTALGKAIRPETTVLQAERLKDACDEGDFDATEFAEVVDAIALELLMPAEKLKEHRKQVKAANGKADRKFDSFNRDEKLTIQASNDPVAELAKQYKTSTQIINEIFDDESTRATEPLGDPAPSPESAATQLLDTEPSAEAIQESLETDFYDDNNHVTFMQAAKDAYAATRLENLRKKILALLHQEGFTDGVVTFTKAN